MNYQQILDRVSKWPKAVAAVAKAREDVANGAPHGMCMWDIADVAYLAVNGRSRHDRTLADCAPVRRATESALLQVFGRSPTNRDHDAIATMAAEGLIVRQGWSDWYDLSPILDALDQSPASGNWIWRADSGQDHISAAPKHPKLKGHGGHSIEMRVDGLGRPVLKIWVDLVWQHSATCRSFAEAFAFLDECEAEAVAQIEAEEPDEYDRAAQEEQDMREMHEEDQAREQAAVEEGGAS